jgi:hypothetical protein
MRLSLKFSVGQNFYAYESFVRARLKQQMFRRCVELSDSLSAQDEKKQRRFASANLRQGAKNSFYVALQTDRGGSPCVEGILASFPCGLRSWPSTASLRYCFFKRIMAKPAASCDAGRPPRRHQLRVFCATPSRKRRPEPVIGAVLHCMSELTG